MNIIREASRRLLTILSEEYSYGRPFLSAPVNPTLYAWGSVLRISSLDGKEYTSILFWSEWSGEVGIRCMEANGIADISAVRLPDNAWLGYGI